MRGRLIAASLLLFLGSIVASGQTTIYWSKDHIYAGPGGGELATVTPAPSDTSAPTAPSSLSVTSTTATTVALSWTGSTDSGGSSLAGYKIYRQKGSGANLPVGTVNSSTTAFTDQPLEPGQSYFYTIVAFDNAQNHSSASGSVNPTTSAVSTDTTAPSVPLALTGRALSSTSVQLNWLAATDAGGSGIGGYQVFRNGSALSSWLSATTLSYQDTTASTSTTYTYTVKAKDNQSNVGSASSGVNVTTP